MRFVRIGDAEIDPEQVNGFVQSVEGIGRNKILVFLKSGQTVTITLAKPIPNLRELLGGE